MKSKSKLPYISAMCIIKVVAVMVCKERQTKLNIYKQSLINFLGYVIMLFICIGCIVSNQMGMMCIVQSPVQVTKPHKK
jgi:hypothetical protein